MPRKLIDLTGEKFGRLTVIKKAGVTERNRPIWECLCDCGSTSNAIQGHLRSGLRVSCGCARKAGNQINKKKPRHGHCINGGNSRTYRIWSGMIARCTNAKMQSWKYYGGMGIKVCDRWRIFENFLSDMGEAPDGLSIDRIKVKGNYEPSNCRWATDIEQHNNRNDSHYLTHNWQTLTISEWARITGLNKHTIADRIRKSKWSVEKALTTAPMTPTQKVNILNNKRWGYPIADTAKCKNEIVIIN